MSISIDRCMAVKNQLLYVVYGNDINYQIETKLSILTLLRHTKKPNFTIRIVTDQPLDYEGWPVEVIAIDDVILQSWLAETKYHYRCKLMGISVLLPYAERTVFLDTDTIINSDANQLFNYSDQEILVDKIFTQWRNHFDDPLVGKVSHYLLKQYPNSYNHNTILFNSGVLGICREDQVIIKQALTLVDELWPIDIECRVLEQFCIAIAINNKKKIIEQNCIYHYWGKKIFFQQVGKYFLETHGFDYKESHPALCQEIKDEVIKPAFIKRFRYRLKVKKLPSKTRRGFLKVLYALDLSSHGFEGAQKLAYWLSAMEKDFLVHDRDSYNDFLKGQWPKNYKHLVPINKQKAFIEFLNTKKVIA